MVPLPAPGIHAPSSGRESPHQCPYEQGLVLEVIMLLLLLFLLIFLFVAFYCDCAVECITASKAATACAFVFFWAFKQGFISKTYIVCGRLLYFTFKKCV